MFPVKQRKAFSCLSRWRVFFLFLCLLVAATGSLGQNNSAPRHLADAEKLLRNLDLKNTRYQHGEGKITWGETPKVQADCSSFIDALFLHCYGYDRETFKKWLGSPRPTAARYHDAIVAQNRFTRIQQVQDIRPGDILAVKYLHRKDNTGHVMLAAAAAQPMKAKNPVVSGTQQWEITIIDCSKSGHGPSDTRHGRGPDGKDHDGLGKGILRIYTDQQGKVSGFSWSTSGISQFKDPAEEYLVIGRLKANQNP